MPSKYLVLKLQEIIAVLRKFEFFSQKGSHAKYSDGKYVVIVPMQDEVAKGTLKSILDMAGISLDDFKSNL